MSRYRNDCPKPKVGIRLPQRAGRLGALLLGSMLVVGSAHGATFVVDSAGDGGAAGSTADGICDAQVGPGVVCTLRAAISEANGTAGADVIQFNIGGGGPQTISPGSALPTITSVVTIDGTTQPGWVAAPIIEINGASSGGANGFTLSAGSAGTTIKGLVIGQFNQGIRLLAGTSGNVIIGNYIGTDKAGTAPRANSVGVFILDSPNNRIGGALAGERNIVSANNPDGIQITGASATGNVVQGNYIGIDATGATALGNAAQGVAIFGSATNNTVGGTGAGEGNVISGNGNIGIGFGQAGTTGNLVEGNFIGTNAAGTAAVPNLYGVGLQATSTGNIIGDAAGSGNVISGNNNSGVLIDNSSGNTIQNNRIGTDVSGNADVGNVQHGIHILNGSNNNVIGGAGVGNVISGNDIRGVDMGGASSGNVFEDNIVGRNTTNTASVPNAGGGIRVDSSNNTVGGTAANVGNVIAGNNGFGVAVTGTATGVAVQQNSIFSNAGLGIDLGANGVTGNDVDDADGGQNNLQNYPVLSAAATDGTVLYIAGALDSAPSTSYRVEFFANSTTVGPDASGFGEGERYLGFANVTTDVNGDAVIGVTLTVAVAAGETVTATATDPGNNSSEFAADVTSVGDLVVTTTADTVDGTVTSVTALIANPGPDGRISLREAIQATNATVGTDTIRFGIPLTDTGRFYYQNDSTASSLTTVGTTLRADADITDFDPDYVGTPFSWFRIQLGSAMDAILDPVILDGYTQPGAQANTVAAPAVSDAILKVVLDGSLLGTGDGLNILSGGTTVRGVVIQKFPGRGVRMATAGGNVLEGCYVGTDPTGTLLASNNNQGIRILAGSNGNTVGGATPDARNVISGQTSYGIYTAAIGTVVQGNFIGTDVTGTVSLANATDGLYIDGGSLNVIGGTSSGARNVISGNGDDGVFLGNATTGNVFQGNYIGVDVTGGALGNLTHGMSFGPSVAGNTIGGTVAGAGNVIAHNTSIGIRTAPTTLSGNSFLSNSIHTNGSRGIDLNADGVTPNDLGDGDSGPNDLLNWPLIYLISEAGGTLTVDYSLDVPAGSYRVEFFKNPSGADPSGNGEGEVFASFVNVTHAGAGPQAFSHSFSGSPGDVVTATTTFCTDGATCAAFGSTSEFGNAFVVGVTAVELTSFNAVGADGAVDLFWQTSSELNNLGFHLYRADSEAGTYERITAAVIPGLGSSPKGASYHYRDDGRANGVAYFYKLEDIDSVGSSEFHGPVSARPREASSDSSEEDAGPTRITIGDPSANAFRVVRRSRDEVVLELETGGFYAEPQEDGSVRLSIPGFDALTEANAPEIPVKRSWVEALAGRRVHLVSVTAREEESFNGLLPSDAEESEIVAGRNGTVRATRSRSTEGSARRARAHAQGSGVYPSELARLLSVGFQGDVKKALVELAPLRWDGATGRLLLTHRLSVRLSFRGLEPDEVTTDGVRGRRRRTVRERAQTAGVVRLATSERGLYAVSFNDVFGRRGPREVSTSELRLSRQGAAVVFHLEPRSDRFGPGSTLYFLSDGAAANPYGNEAVYELELVPGGRTMAEDDASPVGDVVPYFWRTLRREENRYYQAALLDAPDLWLWETILAPESKSFSFHVDALASVSEPSHLRLWLQGASDLPGSPDHHVRVYVNRVHVGALSWDGKQARNIDVALPPGLVLEGENTLEIENVGDTDAAYSMVMLDRFEVVYPRRPAAAGGQLEGAWSAPGVTELFGLGRNAVLLDTTDPQPRWLDGAQTGADGIVRARVVAGRRYLAVSSAAVLKPQLGIASTSGLAREDHRADYLVIAPEAFLPAVAPLLELRRDQGLRVEAVSVEDVYSEFGFGEARPEALEDFLSYAYHAWQSPSPRYVLLVGDATYDFKDYLGTGVRNQVPPLMVETSFLWTASDPAYAAVNGEDLLPDLAIGRLPAASLEEARAMVEKILAYESGEAILNTAPVVLVADDADRAGDFRADAEELASTTLSGRDVEKIYLSELGVASARDSILRAFDEGASLVSYVGHGGIQLWASENLFDTSAVDALSPQPRQPIVLTMNCLNGYFHFPYFDSLAEALLKAEGKGAVAAFSPSGLSLNDSAHRYHQALLEELVHGGHQRLGDAVMAAQADYARTGALPELLSVYHLFGDPALRLW